MFFFFSSRRRHTRCALVTGVQTCALPTYFDEVTRIQERAIAEAIQILEDHNEVLIEAPTGAGKTRINARILEEIAKRAGPDFNSLNLCHRERLATQSQDAFRQWVPESPDRKSTRLNSSH